MINKELIKKIYFLEDSGEIDIVGLVDRIACENCSHKGNCEICLPREETFNTFYENNGLEVLEKMLNEV